MGKKYTTETVQSFFDKYNCFEKLNFTSEEVNMYYNEWQNSNHVFFNDFLWLLFNKLILKNGYFISDNTIDEKEFHDNNYMIYMQMAQFRFEEGASNDVINQMLKLAEDSRLKMLIAQGFSVAQGFFISHGFTNYKNVSQFDKVFELRITKESPLNSGKTHTHVSTFLCQKLENALEEFKLWHKMEGYDFDLKPTKYTIEELTRIGYSGVISYVEPPVYYYSVGGDNVGNKIKVHIEEKVIK